MSLVSIQTWVFISFCSPVMPRMAGTSTGVYEFHSMIRGHDVYKTIWTPVIDETLQVMQEGTNEYAVTITKGGCIHCIVEHIPREYAFLNTCHHHMHNRRL